MTNTEAYQAFYHALKEIRDLFHKSGRFDDSNVKLDEIVKLISLYLYQPYIQLNLRELLTDYEYDHSFDITAKLKQTFSQLATEKHFLNNDGTSIFGSNPQLNIQDNHNDCAYKLLKLVLVSMDSVANGSGLNTNFDLLNEAFGHFVRDNFRNHVEDAQYMTPPEVVKFMAQVALHDLVHSDKKLKGRFVIVDPCCGVGSFLSTFYRLARNRSEFEECIIEVVGQDKVDRMVRLSKINMMLFNTENHKITTGNSLVGESALNNDDGQVDLILTNPPFGAKFSSQEIDRNYKKYPLLHDLARTNGKNFTSELLFIDRCLTLLKPGGRLLVVIPDNVISANGMPAILRQRLSKYALIKLIVELPTVTFAGAGTRTKTHILYLQKRPPDTLTPLPTLEGFGDFADESILWQSDTLTKQPIFMAISDDLGFEVKSRRGGPVKVNGGKNDLPLILEAYISKKSVSQDFDQEYQVVTDKPSCVFVESATILESSWTPNHYNAGRYEAIDQLKSKANQDIELLPLKKVVDFLSAKRRQDSIEEESKCISVLLVMSDGIIDYNELFNYAPKHSGIPCQPGDLLFSKINPRIPRVLIVPSLRMPLTCSSEFEIMNSKIHIDNYAIMMLLRSPMVQEQIQFLTCGTSSSHNRIKTKELKQVLLPIPKAGTDTLIEFKETAQKFKQSIEILNTTYLNLVHIRSEAAKLWI